MGESTKAVLGLVAILGVMACLFGWMIDPPNEVTDWLRLIGPGAVVFSLGAILLLALRPDHAPDYLRRITEHYFNRDGFCFAFVVTVREGVAYLEGYFQAQRNRPCVGQIALRPKSFKFADGAGWDVVTIRVECPPAAYGVVRLPVPIPHTYQGGRQEFEVGASVRYPEGRGWRLRFHDGLFLRTNADFGRTFETAVKVAAAAVGHFVRMNPATVTLRLPDGVAEQPPQAWEADVDILWELGDPEHPDEE